MRPNKHASAFSLVELSIVLVILGLLVGGILAGQSLIRASELRAVSSEADRFKTSIMAFRDKYFGMPGDITNATSFWGKDTTSIAACAAQSGTAATPGTCNGSGDGWVTSSPEMMRVWQHLSLAGLIEGNYAGYMNPNNIWGQSPIIGVEAPGSKIANGGWTLFYANDSTSIESSFGSADLPPKFLQILMIGGVNPTAIPITGVMKAEEAWNIDKKFDDGRPKFGKVRGTSRINGCVTDASNIYNSSATYDLANSNKNCFIGFLLF